MNVWAVRVGALVVALAISAVVFYFWGVFAAAMKTALEAPVAPLPAMHQSTGEVSVSLPSMQKNCPKGQVCK